MYKFKFISVLILASVVFGACSSDDSTETQTTEPAEVPVNFTVTTLTVEDQPMNARTTTRAASTSSGSNIQDVINEIHIFIYSGYDLKKELVSKFSPGTETAPTDFGTFKVNLAPGNYKIYAFAGGKGTGTFEFQSMTPEHDNMSISYNNKELFYYNDVVKIENKASEHDLTVKRQCAALRINISEEIPENVGKVEYKITDYVAWNFHRQNYNPGKESHTFTAGTTNNMLDQFDYYFMSFPTIIDTENRIISFLVYDKSDVLLFEKALEVSLTKNHRTVISGNLFSSLTADGLVVSVDDTWDDDINVEIE